MEGRTEGRKEGQTLFHRTLPATAERQIRCDVYLAPVFIAAEWLNYNFMLETHKYHIPEL